MLFNNSKSTVVAIVIFVAVLILALAVPRCHAAVTDPPYVQISGGEAIVRGYTQAIDLAFTEPASVLRNAYWQESLTVIGTSTFRGQAVPNNFAVRGLFVDGFGRFDIGLGLGWMQNPRPYNGSPVNFNLQLAYRFVLLPVTLTYTHLSNAGSQSPNLGRDLVLLGWRFH